MTKECHDALHETKEEKKKLQFLKKTQLGVIFCLSLYAEQE